MRPIEKNDVVRIVKSKDTGIVIKTFGDNVSVVLTKYDKNEFNFGVWFNLTEVKRIGKVKSK